MESIGAVLEKFATTCTGEVALLLGDTMLTVWAKTIEDASRNTTGMILRVNADTKSLQLKFVARELGFCEGSDRHPPGTTTKYCSACYLRSECATLIGLTLTSHLLSLKKNLEEYVLKFPEMEPAAIL
jgi:hypothetical protein